MSGSKAQKSRGVRALLGALRLLVGGLLILAFLLAFKRLLFPAVQSLLGLEEEAADILGKLGSLAALILGYWVFVRRIEHRRAIELALRLRWTALAAGSGILLISLTLLPLFVLGFYEVVAFQGFGGVAVVAATILTAAMLEEVVFRGLLFGLLEEQVGTLPAIAVVSLLFATVHLGNDGVTAVTVLSVTLLGALWCSIYALSRNLWVVGAHHAAWNFTIFLSGVPLSGLQEWRSLSPLTTEVDGPPLLTGGGFGPEDSVINLGVVALSTFWLVKRLRTTSRALTSPSDDRADDEQRLSAADDRFGKEDIRRLMRPILVADEEAQERSTPAGGMVADGAAQHRVAGLERVEDGGHRGASLDLEMDTPRDSGEGAKVRW